MLQIYAAMAEREARVTGERTKARWRLPRLAGPYSGPTARSWRPGTSRSPGAVAAIRPRLAGVVRRRSCRAHHGLSLNDEGITSPAGGRWHVASLHRALKRLAVAEE